MSNKLQARHVAKTASYTVKPWMDAPGTVFTNRAAAGAVTFTLPKPTKNLLGASYRFLGAVAQNLIVAGAAAGDLILLNDLAGNSLALQTGGQIIGGEIEATCVEVTAGVFKWHTRGVAVGHTYTPTT